VTLSNVEALLSAPRGRGLCLAIAGGLDEQVHSAWLEAAWQPGNDRLLVNLVRLLADVDPSPIRDWTDPLAFADPMDLAVSSAMGWQEPHPDDVISRAAPVVAALGPIAEAVVSAAGASWWPSTVDLDALRYTSRFDRHDNRRPPVDPIPGDNPTRLARWRAAEMQTNQRDRQLLSADPAANYSGHWWSIPALSGLISTTRQLPGLGAIKLIWEEDSPGETDALVWPMTVTRTPRVLEINGPGDWIDLVRHYPLDVSASRRHDWYRVTGRDGHWVIPDYAAVADDWDAVHLTVTGYLTTATRSLAVTDEAATVLAGWDPDQTWWLTDILRVAGPAQRWHSPDDAPQNYAWRPEPPPDSD
jgi:hypothetical protein